MERNRSKVKTRIIHFADLKGFSKRKIYKETGISNGVLDKNNGISEDNIDKFLQTYPEVNPIWLITGKGDMLTNESIIEEESGVYQTQTLKKIPLIPIEKMTKWKSDNTSITDYEIKKYWIPDFNNLSVEFMIKIKSNDMSPNYNIGDIIACKKLPIDTFFQWNKIYVVDTVQGTIVKRIKKSPKEGFVICTSDNKNYESFELHTSQIDCLAIVLGVIKLEQ